MKRFLLTLAVACALPFAPAWAQDAAQPQKSPEDQAAEEKLQKGFVETVTVVSATKTETALVDAPATVSVVAADTIAASPAQNFGDLLRTVPGLNIIQMSARDINLTARQATATLSSSQLTLLDGRSIYLDFFGLILWDLVPTNTNEIKQIEVVRGPASAVWGANALTGVVNIITKSPREAAGTSFTLNGGLINRDAGSRENDGNGQAAGGSVTIARAPTDKLSFKLSGGYFFSDPYSRPVGSVPLTTHPLDPSVQLGGGQYPADGDGVGAFENSSTSQPKVDLRLDQELGDSGSGGRITYQGGYAGTEGIIHTGIGPFDIQSGSYMAYGRVAYNKNALKVAGFVNFVDVEAPNLLNTDPATLQPVQLNFDLQTYDFEVGNSNLLGGRHILSYGGNVRQNNFKITLTPNGEDRTEFGAYLQEEFFTQRFRASVGLRVDKFGNIDDPVLSPRISLMYKPAASHSVRVSFNRAFRSPSAINNFLDQDVFSPNLLDLRPLAPFAQGPFAPLRTALAAPIQLRVKNRGSEVVTPPYELKEESVDAYEIAYTGSFGRTTIGAAVYQNDSNENINFTELVPSAQNPQGLPGFDRYNLQNAPATIGLNLNGVSVPGPLLVSFLALPPINANLPPLIRPGLPRTVTTYLNLGPIRQRGLELSVDHTVSSELSLFTNYSWQDTPKVLEADADQIEYPAQEVGIPSEHRFNAGVNWNSKRFVGTASVNYASEALWTDVLGRAYSGFTDGYTMVNASFGVKFAEGKTILTLKGTNLFNEDVQQHVFGDILKRSVFAELRVFLP
jgi:outer membrane receptor protein involved in Fe transport